MCEIGATRINPRSPDGDYAARVEAAFFGDLTDADLDLMAQIAPTDAPAALLRTPVAVTGERWGTIPRAFVRLRDDRAIPRAMATQFIGEADERFPENPFQVVDLDSSHSPFISRPKEVAELLIPLIVG